MKKGGGGPTFSVIGIRRSGVETVVYRGISLTEAEEAKRVLLHSGACSSVTIRPDDQEAERAERSKTFQQSPDLPMTREPDATGEPDETPEAND